MLCTFTQRQKKQDAGSLKFSSSSTWVCEVEVVRYNSQLLLSNKSKQAARQPDHISLRSLVARQAVVQSLDVVALQNIICFKMLNCKFSLRCSQLHVRQNTRFSTEHHAVAPAENERLHILWFQAVRRLSSLCYLWNPKTSQMYRRSTMRPVSVCFSLCRPAATDRASDGTPSWSAGALTVLRSHCSERQRFCPRTGRARSSPNTTHACGSSRLNQLCTKIIISHIVFMLPEPNIWKNKFYLRNHLSHA